MVSHVPSVNLGDLTQQPLMAQTRLLVPQRYDTQADMINQNISNRSVSSNGSDKFGSNLSIDVKILLMDSNHLTDMGMEAFIGLSNTCTGRSLA
jgi:hypothetical protein